MATISRSRPTTPIRRVSRGSIARASISNASSSSTPLSFLTQAMSDLSYETSTLHSNLECIEEIDQALLTFDESFSMFLYGLRMNAFCVEWPEAPGEENFQRYQERKDQKSSIEGAGLRRVSLGTNTTMGDETIAAGTANIAATGDQTYMTQDDDDAELMQRRPTKPAAAAATAAAGNKPPLKSALKKTIEAEATSKAVNTASASVPVKGRITLAEKKKREAKAAEIIETLPLEYRGSDPSLARLAKSVLLALMANGSKGVRIAEIVKMPELPQAKINKCMIALVTAKQVIKRSDNGVVYQLDPSRHALLQ